MKTVKNLNTGIKHRKDNEIKENIVKDIRVNKKQIELSMNTPLAIKTPVNDYNIQISDDVNNIKIGNLLRDLNSTPIKKDEPKTRYFDFPRIQDNTAGSREDSIGAVGRNIKK